MEAAEEAIQVTADGQLQATVADGRLRALEADTRPLAATAADRRTAGVADRTAVADRMVVAAVTGAIAKRNSERS